MKSTIVYRKDNGHTINAVQDQHSYKAELSIENNQVNLNFIFPKGTKGMDGSSEVFAALLSFSREEAVEINAALNGILHHPEIKDKAITWKRE